MRDGGPAFAEVPVMGLWVPCFAEDCRWSGRAVQLRRETGVDGAVGLDRLSGVRHHLQEHGSHIRQCLESLGLGMAPGSASRVGCQPGAPASVFFRFQRDFETVGFHRSFLKQGKSLVPFLKCRAAGQGCQRPGRGASGGLGGDEIRIDVLWVIVIDFACLSYPL